MLEHFEIWTFFFYFHGNGGYFENSIIIGSFDTKK